MVEVVYSFRVNIEPDLDVDSVFLRAEFRKTLNRSDRVRYEQVVIAWVQQGIEEGYGGYYLHYIDADHFNWLRDREVGKDQSEVYADMGNGDLADIQPALTDLFTRLSGFDFIEQVNLHT